MVFLKGLKKVRNLQQDLAFLNFLLDNCCCSSFDLLKWHSRKFYSAALYSSLLLSESGFSHPIQRLLNRLHSFLSDARLAVFNSLTLFCNASSILSSLNAFWRRFFSRLDRLSSSLLIEVSFSSTNIFFSSIILGFERLFEEN